LKKSAAKRYNMKKLLLLAAVGCFLFSSCYNYRHGRTGWTKENVKQTEKVKPC
jgi:hypothetical protein